MAKQFRLLDEMPLLVLPSLAVKIGLNEAIVLQQIHFLLQNSRNFKDHKRWVYNSFPAWHKVFPFFGLNTMKRAFYNLEQQGLLITGCYNTLRQDKTKWYSINYELLDNLEPGEPPVDNHEDE